VLGEGASGGRNLGDVILIRGGVEKGNEKDTKRQGRGRPLQAREEREEEGGWLFLQEGTTGRGKGEEFWGLALWKQGAAWGNFSESRLCNEGKKARERRGTCQKSFDWRKGKELTRSK